MAESGLLCVNARATPNLPVPGALVRQRVAVLGAGDVGAAVAHALHHAGYRVLLVEGEAPTATRRGMCFVDAVFDGASSLAGLTALRVNQPEQAETAWRLDFWLPLAVAPDLPCWLERLGIDLLVDARMRKHNAVQADLRPLARCTVGLGPGYIAGYNATVVVETAWGDELGRVIEAGPARQQAGDPRPILGASRQRLVCAPVDGVFCSDLAIGEAVMQRQPIGWIEGNGYRVELLSPLTGSLRGLTRPGLRVKRAMRVIEVDPRRDPDLCFGLGERPQRIAQGVLRALERRFPPAPRRRSVAAADVAAASGPQHCGYMDTAYRHEANPQTPRMRE